MSLVQSLTRFSPLSHVSRPAVVAPPPPVEPMDVRDSGPRGVSFAAAAGLALMGLTTLAGTATAQEVRLETARDAAPISQEAWAKMKAAGTVNPRDNASAREVKEAYTRVA